MTRKELSQLYHINGLIKIYEEELFNLENESVVKATPTYVIGGRSQGKVNSNVENMALKKQVLEEMILEYRDKAMEKKIEIMQFMGTISDPLLQKIIYCRCYELLSWKEVATKVGGGNQPDTVRMIFNRSIPKE